MKITDEMVEAAMEAAGVPESERAGVAQYFDHILRAALSAAPAVGVKEDIPQDVVNLVIAAREFWEIAMDDSDECAALDSALEAFSRRVPYEN